MKKLSFLLLSLMAMALLTACNNGNEPSTVQKLTSTINCRAIEGDVVVFSQGTANVEVDYTNMVIKFTSTHVDMDGHSTTLTTPEMKLKNVSPTVYEFTASGSQQVGGSNVESLNGYVDFGTGMMWYSIKTASSEIVCTSQILYAYSTTEISNPDNDDYGIHQKSAYLFAIDSKGETCTLQISNFMSNVNGNVDLDKYNERYETMSSYSVRDRDGNQNKQKIKQKSQQYKKQGTRQHSGMEVVGNLGTGITQVYIVKVWQRVYRQNRNVLFCKYTR